MEIFRKCIELSECGKSCVLVTVTEAEGSGPARTGFKLLVTGDGELTGTVGGGALEHTAIEAAREILKTGRRNEYRKINLADIGMSCGGRTGLFFEYMGAKKQFVLFGGGHVGRAVTPILESLGYQVTIYDCRENVKEFEDLSLGREVVIHGYEDISPVKDLVCTARNCLIFTHGHDGDFYVLKQLLQISSDFEYIGLIGSKRKVAQLFERLKEENIGVPGFVHAPVGLQIGGDTAAEIAVSIAAEVISVHNA